MAHVVFTTIGSIDDLGGAHWTAGDNDSYKNTMARITPVSGSIRLIGRQSKPGTGSVQLCYASFGGGEWEAVNTWHLTLAQYFSRKLDSLPKGKSINVFFESIDDDAARHAAQQLIGLQCGINVTKERFGALHSAVQTIQGGLRALGIPCGDWTFTPMFNGFEVAQEAA